MTKKILGIIPAGGKATRFDGVLKELLPISEISCALTRCVDSMMLGGATDVIVSSTENKYEQHLRVLHNRCTVQINDFSGMWECLMNLASVPADTYLFAMPDTIFPLKNFAGADSNECVTVGTFDTEQSERFGIITDGQIVNKSKSLAGKQVAWGTWTIDREPMEFLAEELARTKDYTDALNSLIANYSYSYNHMDYYYDFASFNYYKEYLCSHI